MGLFNFEKEGPGVSKDAPKKKGIFLFFELLGRKIGKFFQINMLYFIISIPMIAVSFFAAMFFIDYFLQILGISIKELDSNFVLQACFFVTFLFVVFIGSGPASASLAYFNRCVVREEGIFLVSDFFEQFKKNFKQGIIVGIINPLLTFAMLFGIMFYINLAKLFPAYSTVLFICTIFLFIICAVFVSSSFYMYQLMITFENSVFELYKNAVIMALINLPMNIFLMLIVFVINYFIFFILSPIASIILFFLCWAALMRFIPEFYTSRAIKRKIIDNIGKEN